MASFSVRSGFYLFLCFSRDLVNDMVCLVVGGFCVGDSLLYDRVRAVLVCEEPKHGASWSWLISLTPTGLSRTYSPKCMASTSVKSGQFS